MKSRPVLVILLAFLSTETLYALDMAKEPPALIAGTLDCRTWDFNAQGMIKLKGEAEFHWRRFMAPEDYKEAEPGEYLPIPAAWNNVPGASFPAEGYGTYRIRLFLPEDLPVLGIYMSNQDSSYRLFIDGNLVSENGRPGPSMKETTPQRLPRVLYPAVEKRSMELILQVANFEHHLGGLNNKIIIGTPDQISALNRLYLSFSLLLFGGFFILFLYHGSVFAFRPSDRTHLYIALFTLILSLRLLFTGEYLGYQWFPRIPWGLGIKYEYLSMPLFVFFFALFLSEMVPQRYPKPLLKIIGSLTLGLSAVLLVLPARISAGHLTLAVQLITLLCGLGVFFLFIRTFQKKESGAALMLIGLGGLLLTAGWDVLVWNKILPDRLVGPMMYPGFLFFILTNTLLLSRRMAAAYNRLDYLSSGLEREVAGRTKELEEANTKIQGNADAQMNFLIHLAHEIKTPLTLILNHLDSYISHTEPSRELAVIKSNLDRLLEDLLDFFDIYRVYKNQEMYTHRETCDFSVLLKEKLLLLESSFRKKNLTVECSLADRLVILAAPKALERLILNLLENAVKYNRNGGTITVNAVDDGKYLLFSVADSGVGIPKENLSDIFLPYYRVSGTGDRVEGMGIGLAVVHHIVESLKGTISCSTPAEGGALFTVRLPLASAETREEDSTKTSQIILRPAQEETDEKTAGEDAEKILLVEDDPDMRDLLREGLQREYRLSMAEDGRDALRILKETEKPSLILSDVMMKEMNGDELLRQLKADPVFKDIPFLLCTARGYDEDAVAAYDAGALDFICKPFLMPELRAKIRSLLAFTRMKEDLARKERLAGYGTVLSGLAHEIKNPLSGITGPLAVIKKHFTDGAGIPPLLEKHFTHIEENIRHINNLTGQMKELYTDSPPEISPVSLKKLVDEVLDTLTLPEGIGIQLEVPPAYEVPGHATILKLAITQVIKNALEALGDKGLIILRSNAPSMPPGISIEDNGPGIPPEILPGIFEPFSSTKQGHGRGLGLTIARSLLTKIHWKISVLPDIKTGTKCRIEEDIHG